MNQEKIDTAKKTSRSKTAEPQRRDKRYIVLALAPTIFKKKQGLGAKEPSPLESARAWGPFHKREQASAWASENLAIPYAIVHSEAP